MTDTSQNMVWSILGMRCGSGLEGELAAIETLALGWDGAESPEHWGLRFPKPGQKIDRNGTIHPWI